MAPGFFLHHALAEGRFHEAMRTENGSLPLCSIQASTFQPRGLQQPDHDCCELK